MILLALQLKIDPRQRLNVLNTIHSIIGPTSVQSGCLHCGSYSNTQNDDDLILLEKWESQKDLERHIRSDEFRKIIGAMEAASKPPEIHFITVSSMEGMELVEKILG
jgi:quinol monooxygenase YgiN